MEVLVEGNLHMDAHFYRQLMLHKRSEILLIELNLILLFASIKISQTFPSYSGIFRGFPEPYSYQFPNY